MGDGITVAVLGTGIMGAPMARNLAEAGMTVRVWNRSQEKSQSLADSCEVADSPAAAARGADVVITMLADADVIEEVVDDGALAALADDGLWLQMSTVGIAGAQRLEDIADRHGVTYVDAPVLGTKQPAEGGNLLILASGPDSAQERCAPVFEVLGQATQWVGPAGAGSRLKVVTNGWILGLLNTLAESIALAQAVDVDPAHFLQAIESAPVGSPYAQIKGPAMIAEEFPPSFSAQLARKDVGLVLAAAREAGLTLDGAEVVARHLEAAIDAGYGGDDMAAIYEAVKPGGPQPRTERERPRSAG